MSADVCCGQCVEVSSKVLTRKCSRHTAMYVAVFVAACVAVRAAVCDSVKMVLHVAHEKVQQAYCLKHTSVHIHTHTHIRTHARTHAHKRTHTNDSLHEILGAAWIGAAHCNTLQHAATRCNTL